MGLLHKLFTNDDKDPAARVVYGWAPVGISMLSLVISWMADRAHPGTHWTARAGAIVALCGAISSYGGATRIWDRTGTFRAPGDLVRGIRDVPYGLVGLLLGVAGTVLWAYGDCWL